VAWARAVSRTGGRFFRSWAGYYFFKAGLYEEAAHEYEAAIRYGSQDVTDYLGLANSLRALGRPAEAEKVLLQAAEKIGDDARVYLSLGSTYILLQDLDKAEQAFSRAASINPKLHAAWVGLGRVSLRLGKIRDAVEAYAKADALGGLRPRDRFEYALACENAGLLKRALKQYEQAARESPKGRWANEAKASAARLRNLSDR
jgi:tetratricopeptide (TPR) repeat protein